MPYRPWMDRTVGVEMETTSTTTTNTSLTIPMIRRALRGTTDRLGSRDGYYHSDGNTWDVKTDSSCGYEIASPALHLDAQGDNIELQRVCEALTRLQPVVNRSCGLHVHVDCSDFNWRKLQMLMALWCRYEPFFFELMPPARRTNHFCYHMHRSAWSGATAAVWNHIRQALDARTEGSFNTHARHISRYAALNVSGWWRHGRVEFRLHSGTINYAKVKHWAMLCSAVIGRVNHPELPPVSTAMRSAPRASGFSTVYIGRQLGLLPSRQVPQPAQEGINLMAWINSRRLQFTPESVRYGGPTQRPETVASASNG